MPHIYGLTYQNLVHLFLAQNVNFFNLIKCKFLQFYIQGIFLGFRIGGNYYLTCGFLVALKHMIGKIS